MAELSITARIKAENLFSFDFFSPLFCCIFSTHLFLTIFFFKVQSFNYHSCPQVSLSDSLLWRMICSTEHSAEFVKAYKEKKGNQQYQKKKNHSMFRSFAQNNQGFRTARHNCCMKALDKIKKAKITIENVNKEHLCSLNKTLMKPGQKQLLCNYSSISSPDKCTYSEKQTQEKLSNLL